jgi:hypothetical protein
MYPLESAVATATRVFGGIFCENLGFQTEVQHDQLIL